jgi:hypothetical protein
VKVQVLLHVMVGLHEWLQDVPHLIDQREELLEVLVSCPWGPEH